jgi:predicted dinucleotide-binding enzyme
VGKVLVDISNPITPDYKALTVGHTTSAAEEIQKLAPQANVVKAYNTIFAELLPADARKGWAVQVFVAAMTKPPIKLGRFRSGRIRTAVELPLSRAGRRD